MSAFTEKIVNSIRKEMLDDTLRANLMLNGEIFWVLNPSDTDFNKIQQRYPGNVFTTLKGAYDACTTNRNDVIMVSANTHNMVSTMLTFSKNRIHVFGMGTYGATDMQPEIALETAATVTAATMKVTGFGNTFTNVYITNNGTDATSLAALIDAGENTVYTNCHFSKQSDLDEVLCANVLAGGDTTTWRNCKFGVDWLTVSAARASLLISTTSGGIMKHNIFEDCYFIQATSSANALHILVKTSGSISYSNIWKNCIFMNPVMTTGTLIIQTKAVSCASAGDGSLFFINPACNSTDFCTDSTKVVVVGMDMNGGAGTATVGVAITPA